MHIVLFGILLGVIGTAVGGVISILIGKRSDTVICCLLAFAGGIMSSISFFELIPEAMELTNVYVAIGGILSGVVLVLLLNKLVDRITAKKDQKLHETHEELYHQTALIEKSKTNERLFRSGLIMFFAITLHNIPEGLAIGAATSRELQLGLTISIMIGVHNIPEGMAVAAPLIAGGVKKWKVMLWTTIAGLPTVIGGLAGFFLGNVSGTFQSVCLAVSGGAMLYVVFGEIIPQSVTMTKSRLPTIIALVGIVAGLLIVQI
ncbi:MAG: ZIP family metal transporter [Firmicutes bacterium]|nr:ZIP family metal transporter [Bacillota bacterium]